MEPWSFEPSNKITSSRRVMGLWDAGTCSVSRIVDGVQELDALMSSAFFKRSLHLFRNLDRS